MTATFSGTLKGMGVKNLTAATELTATLFSAKELSSGVYYYNYGTPLTEPKLFSNGYDNLVDAIKECSYLTKTFEYGSTDINLEQKTAFIKVNLQYFAARVYIDYDGKTYTIDVPGHPSGSSYKTTPVIAVPDGASIRASFLSEQKDIDVSSGNVLYNINRTLPTGCIPASFSISKDEQVFFSESNIGCRKGSYYNSIYVNTNQWDIVNPTNNTNVGNNHENVNNWDLFGWGTWLKAQSQSDPIYTSVTNSDYTWPNTDPHTDAAFSDENPGWFTLTADEWDYLLNTRKMANDNCLRYVRASIKKTDGEMIPGLILFPDAEEYSIEINIISAFKGSGGYSGLYNSFDNYIEENRWTSFCSCFNNGEVIYD